MMSSKKEEPIDLPPGFRFHPTDEEIITNYLVERIKDKNFSAIAIGQADLNKCEPWDLPGKAIMGEKEWYFFCQRDRKYPTGNRTNRATQSGYWKATGKDKEIFYKGKDCLIGMKKTLVFYKGRAPRGEKTNWVMHEYRLEGKSSFWNLPKSFSDDWVVSRVFHKNTGLKNTTSTQDGNDDDDEPSSLPSLMESSPYQMNNSICSNHNIQIHDGFDSNSASSSTYMNPNFNYYYNSSMDSNPYFYPQTQTPTMVYSDLHGVHDFTRTASRQEIGDTIVSSSTSTAPVDFDDLLNTYT